MANLNYYLEAMFNEGKQADEYRARKAAEKKKEEDGYKAAAISRYKKTNKYEDRKGFKDTNVHYASKPDPAKGKKQDYDIGYKTAGDRMSKDNPTKNPIKRIKGKNDDIGRRAKADDMIRSVNKTHVWNSGEKGRVEHMRAMDAANRHLRRHNESVILNPELI